MSGRGKSQKSLDLIRSARDILVEIQPASVRAVCYRLFVAGLIPSMEKTNTNMVSTQLVWAREQGIIPWAHIVDETREPETVGSWSSPKEIFEIAAKQYRYDYWGEQPRRVEVWSEKGTIRGTLAPVLNKYAITLRVMHGHASATTVYDAASSSLDSEKPFHVLYVGDFDPSGMHMSQVDLPERIERYGGYIIINRIAIDWELDTQDDSVPHFPVRNKQSDPRYAWFRDEYGDECFELDALSPKVLRQRVEDRIQSLINVESWARAEMIEAAQRETTQRYMAGLSSISMPATKYDGAAP